jgi:histidine kinase/DNA gyrase B/HSP90-like ATPase
MARFRTQARAVDMLGRQQIAGVPAAMVEVFKNAHDAYADRVEIDYFYQDDLVVIRDDGIGMSSADLEARWLTLGTDSKVGSEPPVPDPNKSKRPTLGEKGIGRLAIALLGSQVLLLSRSASRASNGQIAAAFINWSLFRCTGITLEDVEIPMRTFDAADAPSKKDIQGMIEDIRKNVIGLRKKIGSGAVENILGELAMFAINPTEVLRGLGKPSLFGPKGRGFCCLIQPANRQIGRDVDLDRKGTDQISDLRRQLLGFSNTMLPGAKPPRIVPKFRY